MAVEKAKACYIGENEQVATMKMRTLFSLNSALRLQTKRTKATAGKETML